jgi:hypothetical protein
MMRSLILSLAVAVCLSLSGCSSSADSAMKETIAAMNDYADSVERGDSEEKQKEFEKKMKDIGEKYKDLKVTDAEKKRLEEKYKPEMEKVMKRMMAAMMKKGMQDFGKGFMK